MREKILTIAGFLLTFAIGFMVGQITFIKTQKPNEIIEKVIDRSLDKYTISHLSNIQIATPKIQTSKLLKDYPTFTSNEFVMNFNANLDGKTINKTSGLINIPKKPGNYPILVMIRGFVGTKDYFIGNGTINASYFFANNNFITISPDFLGYGDSDPEPSNIFEARFQTYITMMALLKSLDQISNWDHKNIEIWAHSNGGQVALTTLEITGINYPTVLWAPVSAPFPFSVLYYSDGVADKGKFLRKQTSGFEDVYNSDLYSLTNYLNQIKTNVQLDQGTSDDAVPISWSNSLAKSLKSSGLNVNYNIYPGVDHQMAPLWNKVIQKDLEFLKENLH